jgi:hypothetical protein
MMVAPRILMALPQQRCRHPTFRSTPSQLMPVQGLVEFSSGGENAMPHPYRSHILEHLGHVAAMFDELGNCEVIDRVTRRQPAMRIVTMDDAVNATVLNGLGFVPPLRYGSRGFSRINRPRDSWHSC